MPAHFTATFGPLGRAEYKFVNERSVILVPVAGMLPLVSRVPEAQHQVTDEFHLDSPYGLRLVAKHNFPGPVDGSSRFS